MSKKHSYEYVKTYIESFGYKLLSKEYKNCNTKLELVCNKNHTFYMNFKDLKRGHGCPICAKVKKYTYSEIKTYIESFGYKLLSKEYKNCNTKLELVCSNGHLCKIRFYHFKKGVRCSKCKGLKKHSYEYVKTYIESFGYQLLSKDYKNNKQKLELICSKGHLYKTRFDSFKRGVRCPVCYYESGSSKIEKEIQKYVKSIYDGKIINNDRTTIINPLTKNYLELDIYCPDIKFALEFNGDYWHSDPYQQIKDKIKQDQCKKQNINLLVINEYNFINNEEKCFSKIFDVINKGL